MRMCPIQEGAQMEVMNEEYRNSGFFFRTESIDYTVNDAWASAGPETQSEYDFKKALRRGGYDDLNLYFQSNLEAGLLGYW